MEMSAAEEFSVVVTVVVMRSSLPPCRDSLRFLTSRMGGTEVEEDDEGAIEAGGTELDGRNERLDGEQDRGALFALALVHACRLLDEEDVVTNNNRCSSERVEASV